MPPVRTRLAVALVSAAVIGLQLALMRSLALRWWSHFAHMVVSVALLGFGASGTALALVRPRLAGRERAVLAAAALAVAVSVPAADWLGRQVPVDVPLLAWDLRQFGWVLVLELVVLVPFLPAATVVGLALMDRPERIAGHYAASLAGSGAGGAATVLLMHVVRTEDLPWVMAAAALVAGALAAPWETAGPVAPSAAAGRPGRTRRRTAWAAAVAGAAGLLALAAWCLPRDIAMSPYKMLPQVLAMPGSRVVHEAEGPLGRLDVVEGPAVHFAPGLSLQYAGPVPPHVLLILDGEGASAVYDVRRREDWEPMDWTTAASAYHVRPPGHVLVLGAGGGSDIGLALHHGARAVTALEVSPQVVSAMRGPLAERGGGVYDAAGVRVLEAEARGLLASSRDAFDLIQLPAVEAFGASGAGLYATQESYLYTVEAFAAMLDRLAEGGVLAVTRWARTPPRDGLRVFDTAAEALRRRGADPASRLAMIRSWATVTVLAFRRPMTEADGAALRAFSEARGFDVAYLPDVRPEEVNRFHVLDRPYDYEGALALLGPRREEFLSAYPFHVEAATDDRPYFGRFLRWRSLPALWAQLGARTRAYLEVGYLMLVAAVVQAVVLAAGLVVVPLAPRTGELRRARGRGAALAYFLLIGAGFMLLEMAMLQKLVLYLAHPVYAASVVISSFLVFAGAGSLLSGRWRGDPRRVAAGGGAVVVALGAVCVAGADAWLTPTQGAAAWVRVAVAAGTIAPPAVAMGHLLPAGLRAVAASSPALVPWTWAANGFASVVATAAAPLAAMHAGLRAVMLAGLACYAAAAVVARWVGRPGKVGGGSAPAGRG